MLQSRLQKRLRELKIESFKEYADFVFSPEGQKNEVIHPPGPAFHPGPKPG
ncbi:MAG: hypothetical protein SVX38_13885 [Chloroflexota bacterium]|nr:hypothetical protein [Chloroflexota bacterium]